MIIEDQTEIKPVNRWVIESVNGIAGFYGREKENVLVSVL